MDFKFTVTNPAEPTFQMTFDGYISASDAEPFVREMLNAMADGLERHGFQSEAVIYHTTKERI